MIAQSTEQEKKNFNIAVVQIYDDNIKEYAEYSRLLNAMYAHEKGYTYIAFEYDLVPVAVSVYYNKILAVETILKDTRNFDWVLYLDSDAAVYNFDYKIEDIIDRHPNKEIIITQDSNGGNNGVFLLKNTPKMREFFRKVYEDKQFYHSNFPEQTAMFYHLQQDEYKALIGIESPHHMNAYLKGYADLTSTQDDIKNWDNDSFIVHFFKLPTKDRVNLFKQILLKQNIICIGKPEETSKIEVPTITVEVNK